MFRKLIAAQVLAAVAGVSAVLLPAQAAQASGAAAAEAVLAWADPGHPEIDYSKPFFRSLSDMGFSFHGWWAFKEETDEIDNSPRVLGINLSAVSEHISIRNKRLLISCRKGLFSLTYDADKYIKTGYGAARVDIAYRIDGAEAVSTSWLKLKSSTGAGLKDARGYEMANELLGAERMTIRATARDGEEHDAEFQLAGIGKVVEAAALACEQ